MNAIGLKYVGKREEGISVMLFRSYKTVKVNKIQPYRFTSRDIVSPESINYYNRLANLGLAIITNEEDFNVGSKRRVEVRKEPLAAETDVQLDPTQAPKTVEDQMADELPKNDPPADENVTPANVDTSDSDEDDTITSTEDGDDTSSVVPTASEEFSVDKEAIKSMSAEELSEYLEMNFSKDQLKSLISELGLDISAGRKGVPTLVGEIVAAAELDSLISYLSK